MNNEIANLNDRPTVFYGGNVLTLDGRTSPSQALAIDHGRVLGVGGREAMCALAGPKARLVDVQGGTVMPGIIDTHPHLLHFSARAFHLVDITDARNHAEILERIRRKAAETPEGEWIRTTPVGEPHYFVRRSYKDLEERCLPNRFA